MHKFCTNFIGRNYFQCRAHSVGSNWEVKKIGNILTLKMTARRHITVNEWHRCRKADRARRLHPWLTVNLHWKSLPSS